MLGRVAANASLALFEASAALPRRALRNDKPGTAARIALLAILAVSAYGWTAQLGLGRMGGADVQAASITFVPAQRTEAPVIVVGTQAPAASPTILAEAVEASPAPNNREASVAAAAVPAEPTAAAVVPPPAEPKPAAAAVDTPAPAPVATDTPIPAPTPAARIYTAAEVRGFARQAGWDESLLDAVVVVATCESGLYSGAQGGGALGLMQVMPWWFDRAGIDISRWSDPVANLTVAKFVYEGSGWSAWSCSPPPAKPAPAPQVATPAAAN